MILDERHARLRACPRWAGLLVLALYSSPAAAAPADNTSAPPDTVDTPVDEVASSEAAAPSEATAPSNPDEPARVEQEPETAAQWYERGVELGAREQYERAAEAFLRSYELKPTSEALFNAAVAHENAEDPVRAIKAYQRFLDEPARSDELAQVAERAVASLMGRVGVLKSVRHDEARPPAELRVNGELVELDAFPLIVSPGDVEVSVVDERGEQRSERYELSAGDSLVLDIRALLPEPEPELEPEPERPPPEPEVSAAEQAEQARQHALQRRAARLRSTSFATLGLTGGAGAAALTLGLLANTARQRYEQQTCFEFPSGTCPDGFEIGDPSLQRRNYERYFIGTAVTGSVSAGFAIVALVTGLVSLRYERASRGQDSEARVELRPVFGGVRVAF